MSNDGIQKKPKQIKPDLTINNLLDYLTVLYVRRATT